MDERRNPRTNATVNQLLDKHFELCRGEVTTLETYRAYADNHVRPLIGEVKVGSLGGDIFDSFMRSSAGLTAGENTSVVEIEQPPAYLLSPALIGILRVALLTVDPALLRATALSNRISVTAGTIAG